jgi:VIT1/CCC1 family predicted Fe2+/Mn2+ transporter
MTAQASPPALGEQEADTRRPFSDAIEASASITPAKASQPEQPGHLPARWLGPTSGAMVGLTASASLIAGVSGGGASPHAIVLTGLAGLAAGALSIATARYAAVSSHNELVRAQAHEGGMRLLLQPDAEEARLGKLLRSRGFGAELADSVARQVSADPEQALAVHLREEFGTDHRHLPSPVTAAVAALASFAVGALTPLLPYLLGFAALPAALALAAVFACFGGGLVARLTGRPVMRSVLQQLLSTAVVVVIIYIIGHFVGAV